MAQDDTIYARDVIEETREAIGAYLDEVIPEDLDIEIAPEEWSGFFATLDGALQSRSLEELAWLQPMVGRVLEFIEPIPSMSPLADWLRQRKDYFDMAKAVVEQPSDIMPVLPKPKPVPAKRVTARPAESPMELKRALSVRRGEHRPDRKPMVAPATALARARKARDPQVWKRAMAERPPPSTAGELAPRLKRAFQGEGVPAQLVWIAEVESTMHPEARSPAGAVGLFQLMPQTARGLGLRTGGGDDERKHPDKSARVAARYLKRLYGRFGSWPLTLAAYNNGEGNIEKLLKRHQATTFDGIAEHLPIETQLYVPKVTAVISLREGVDLASLPPPSA